MAEPDDDLETSIGIDDVERMQTIGTGSFGRVYLARDTINKKNYYALKKMSINKAYRDLKPENLMLTKIGHLKLTDFGFAKIIADQTNTLCGTPEYLAPEVIDGKGYDKSVDWWSLGILIYEMLVGLPPFQGDTVMDIYAEIMTDRIHFPKSMDFFTKDFIKMLLQLDPAKRLGNLKGGAKDIKIHKWFNDIIWDDVINMKITSPIIPRLRSTGDTSNFDDYDEESDEEQRILSQEEIDLFHDW
ncbi:cAMP-dependent protein kinase catalytic subunit [Dirofilaria immitis]|nr:cAMP-dependent protein kinase catalytic subunit [Dirofilaria immitis]